LALSKTRFWSHYCIFDPIGLIHFRLAKSSHFQIASLRVFY
jgi:hypothetical protein